MFQVSSSFNFEPLPWILSYSFRYSSFQWGMFLPLLVLPGLYLRKIAIVALAKGLFFITGR